MGKSCISWHPEPKMPRCIHAVFPIGKHNIVLAALLMTGVLAQARRLQVGISDPYHLLSRAAHHTSFEGIGLDV
ncbi:hypothetical protein [Synechococcus sp. M16CYN]|uniref:hypothetical protein n=1 Tax=Synechococcus sp. M16CYN TaxID=3103139 RepID=UPI0033424BC1